MGLLARPPEMHIRRRIRRALLGLFLALLLTLMGWSEYRPTPMELLIAPYRYSLLDWEAGNLPDKWARKLANLLSFRAAPDSSEALANAEEFFELGLELKRLEQQLQFPAQTATPSSGTDEAHPRSVIDLEPEIEAVENRRKELARGVEQTIEEGIDRTLATLGLAAPWGAFPPVDTVFGSSPKVLVLSPRDRIESQETFLLEAGLDVAAREEIEKLILEQENLAALVENTGGVAVYPSVVADTFGLHHAVVTTAHEWLHQWFFFRPLGRNFWSSHQMTVLNETAATIAGIELGDMAYTALTGNAVNRTESSGEVLEANERPDQFDFNREMRETRLRAEELLAQGLIEEAEAYMEERRLLFVENGYLIRKINQAYFAFHGTYATSPASVSPIGQQMRELRAQSGSLEEFLNTVSGFGSYQEFLDHLDEHQSPAEADVHREQ